MAPLSRLSLLCCWMLAAAMVSETLAAPSPLRVPMGRPDDDDDGPAGELADGYDDASAEADSTGNRPVAILEHRQELQDDGTFNYAFSADNGLTQNEAFHPDGSRTGSYSYVDPKGETILVKYRADRFGFHVLDGSSIPSTPPHIESPAPADMENKGSIHQAASSDYGGEQGVLDPNYFNFPSLGPSRGSSAGKLKVAATSGKGGRIKAIKAGGKVNKALGTKSARAQSSASSSMHFLRREARQAFVSDGDADLLDVDGQESRVAMKTVRAPPGMAGMTAADANNIYGTSKRMTAAHDASSDHHALKYDDGSYDSHAAKYDDGSYEPHAAKYDDGSYQSHAMNYDDGSYERHAANYDDGSYEPHAAKYDDGSYEKYAKLYDDGRYGSKDGEGQGEGESEDHP